MPAFEAAYDGKKPVCPICGSSDTTVKAGKGKDNIGFVIVGCNSCKEFERICRGDLTNYKGPVEIIE